MCDVGNIFGGECAGVGRFQHYISTAAKQRVEAFHVGNQFQVQGAGLQALDDFALQAADVGVGQTPFLGAETAFLAQ